MQDSYTTVELEAPPHFIYLNIAHPVVAWECYRGSLIPAQALDENQFTPLSLWLLSLLKVNVQKLVERRLTEIALERVRQTNFPQKASRLKAMYYFEDKESALRAAQMWGTNRNHFNEDCLVEVGLDPSAIKTKVDSNWITECFTQIGNTNSEWMQRYWNGEPYPGKEPLWEILTYGRSIIWGTELRERCYSIVESASPLALPLLELSRIACECDSDYGHTVPFAYQISDCEVEIRFAMNIKDQNTQSFRKKLEDYKGPKRFSELPGTVTSLDLSRYFFRVPIHSLASFVIP